MIFVATLLWSSKSQDQKGIAVCPYCNSVTGFDEDDLEGRNEIPRCLKGRKVIIGYRGFLKCANPDCQKNFEAECKS